MRAAIYLRVSTEDQAEKFGLQVQRERCEAMATVKGWEVAKTFADEGLSGALDVTERPGLRALMDAATAGTIDAVIVGSLDRLGRQTRIVLGVAERLASLKVELLSCRENLDTSTPTGQFVLTMFAALAQLEKDTIRDRTMSGSMKAVEQGNVITGGARAPYGYATAEIDGNRTFVINEAEAEVVRLILTKYASGNVSLHELAAYLSERNIPPPTKGKLHKARRQSPKWAPGSLHNILNNETYVGRWYYRKTRRVKQANGKYTKVARPRSEWICIDVPPIIDDETFKLVQERRKANKCQMGKRRRYTYGLGGMLKCAHCGVSVSGATTRKPGKKLLRYYRCNAKNSPKRYGYKCETPTLRAEDVEATVWAWVSSIVTSPEKLREGWEEYRQKALSDVQPIIDMVEANTRKIDALQAERRRLVKAYREGVLTLEDLAADKTDIERTIEQYTNANEELQADISGHVPGKVDFDTIEQYAEELQLGALEGIDNLKKQGKLYRALHMKGELIHENGASYADVTCILGRKRLPTSFNLPSRVRKEFPVLPPAC